MNEGFESFGGETQESGVENPMPDVDDVLEDMVASVNIEGLVSPEVMSEKMIIAAQEICNKELEKLKTKMAVCRGVLSSSAGTLIPVLSYVIARCAGVNFEEYGLDPSTLDNYAFITSAFAGLTAPFAGIGHDYFARKIADLKKKCGVIDQK